MNYRQAIDQCLENFKEKGFILLSQSYSICSYDHLKIIYNLKVNSTEFYNNYILLNASNNYHFVTITDNKIQAFPIGFISIESYIIKYIFPEYLKPEIQEAAQNIKFFENTKKKSLESFDPKTVKFGFDPLIEEKYKRQIQVLDLNPKIIQFQVVNIGSNTYRYSLLDNGEIIKETYSSCGNFTK